MAGEWGTVSLREAGVTLIDCDHRTPPAATSGYPYVAIPQLKEGRLVLSDARRISHEHFVEWTRKAKPQHHDVILSRRCNPGETAYVPGGIECALGQNLVLLRADGKRLHPPFLRWLVRSPDWWEQIGTFINVGAVFESLRCADIPNFRLPIPPLPEQRAIASVLGALDNLIELNRETNEILEQMARALFKSWFVDFDPVRAKLEGRAPAGMDAATAALFPEHFQDSEIGQIPRGWQVVTLGSVLDTLETGRRPKGGVSGYSSGFPSVGAESINGIGVFDFSKTKFIPREFYEKTASGRVKNLDVLLYKDGGKPGEFRPRVGLFGYGFPFDEFCINEHVFRMRAESVGQHYLYFAVSDERVLLDFANKGGKAAIPGINQTDVRSTLILMPPMEILTAFEGLAQPICQTIIENAGESRDLATLRDTLLPKLLSGEVTVTSPEDIAAAAS
jgi:type I restriction enzyme S subunit